MDGIYGKTLTIKWTNPGGVGNGDTIKVGTGSEDRKFGSFSIVGADEVKLGVQLGATVAIVNTNDSSAFTSWAATGAAAAINGSTNPSESFVMTADAEITVGY